MEMFLNNFSLRKKENKYKKQLTKITCILIKMPTRMLLRLNKNQTQENENKTSSLLFGKSFLSLRN